MKGVFKGHVLIVLTFRSEIENFVPLILLHKTNTDTFDQLKGTRNKGSRRSTFHAISST